MPLNSPAPAPPCTSAASITKALNATMDCGTSKATCTTARCTTRPRSAVPAWEV